MATHPASSPIEYFAAISQGIFVHLSGWNSAISWLSARFRQVAGELFNLVERGVLRMTAIRTYPLGDVVTAHRQVEAASDAGPVVLLP